MTRFEDIKAFAFDVDGVFTDGLVLAMPDGDLLRQFNSKDCYSVRTAVNNGYPCAIITGGVSQSLLHRSRSLGVEDRHLYMLSKDKAEDFLHYCRSVGLDPAQVVFVGDDIPDIPAYNHANESCPFPKRNVPRPPQNDRCEKFPTHKGCSHVFDRHLNTL